MKRSDFVGALEGMGWTILMESYGEEFPNDGSRRTSDDCWTVSLKKSVELARTARIHLEDFQATVFVRDVTLLAARTKAMRLVEEWETLA